MKIFIGSDHGGTNLKQEVIALLSEMEIEYTDCGSFNNEATDYPDFALAVSKAVVESPASLGILICRSGEGMEIAANKVNGIRASLVWEPEIAKETRQDNDANILALPADYITTEKALDIVKTFISTDFSNIDRHIRRIEKIKTIERAYVS